MDLDLLQIFSLSHLRIDVPVLTLLIISKSLLYINLFIIIIVFSSFHNFLSNYINNSLLLILQLKKHYFYLIIEQILINLNYLYFLINLHLFIHLTYFLIKNLPSKIFRIHPLEKIQSLKKNKFIKIILIEILSKKVTKINNKIIIQKIAKI